MSLILKGVITFTQTILVTNWVTPSSLPFVSTMISPRLHIGFQFVTTGEEGHISPNCSQPRKTSNRANKNGSAKPDNNSANKDAEHKTTSSKKEPVNLVHNDSEDLTEAVNINNHCDGVFLRELTCS